MIAARESLVAGHTNIGSLARMQEHMALEMLRDDEALVANGTLVGSIARMRPHVGLPVDRFGEAFAACAALEWTLARFQMTTNVLPVVFLRFEWLLA